MSRGLGDVYKRQVRVDRAGGPLCCDESDAHSWVVGEVLWKARDQQLIRKKVRNTDDQVAVRARFGRLSRCGGLPKQAQHLDRMGVDSFTRLGERDAGTISPKQGRADRALQIGQEAAQGRLRLAQR